MALDLLKIAFIYYKKIYYKATFTYQGKPGIFLRSQFALRPDSLSRHHMILEQIGGMRLRIANFEIELLYISNFVSLIYVFQNKPGQLWVLHASTVVVIPLHVPLPRSLDSFVRVLFLVPGPQDFEHSPRFHSLHWQFASIPNQNE